MKVLGGVAAWPFTARAQQREKVRRIGVLITLSARDSEARAWVSALKEGLQKLGWEQDRNIRIDYRWSAGDPDRIWAFAAELVELAPDVILCSGAQTTTVLQRVTHTFNGNSDGIGQMNMRASVESEWAHARRP